MDMKTERPSLSRLANGELEEMFQDALNKVAANILDPNTPAEKSREIVLRIRVAPTKNRSASAVSCDVKVKLQSVEPSETQMFFASSGDPRSPEVSEYNPQQLGFNLSDDDGPEEVDEETGEIKTYRN